MDMVDESQIRRALEKIASHNGFWDKDVETLGRILALENHPKISSLHHTTSASGSANLDSYEARLKERMTDDEVQEMLISQGFQLGEYTVKPFYDLVSEGNKLFQLYIKQPSVI